MNTLLVVVSVVSALCTAFVSCFHAWLDYRKQKERDDAWEAAVRLFSSSQEFTNPIEDFADFYAVLSYIRKHPGADYQTHSIRDLMRRESDTPER